MISNSPLCSASPNLNRNRRETFQRRTKKTGRLNDGLKHLLLLNLLCYHRDVLNVRLQYVNSRMIIKYDVYNTQARI